MADLTSVADYRRRRARRSARVELAAKLEALSLPELLALSSAIVLTSAHRIDEPLLTIAGFVANALDARGTAPGGAA